MECLSQSSFSVKKKKEYTQERGILSKKSIIDAFDKDANKTKGFDFGSRELQSSKDDKGFDFGMKERDTNNFCFGEIKEVMINRIQVERSKESDKNDDLKEFQTNQFSPISFDSYLPMNYIKKIKENAKNENSKESSDDNDNFCCEEEEIGDIELNYSGNQNHETFKDIVLLQKVDGNWKNEEKLFKLLELEEQKFKDNLPNDLNEEIFITMIVIYVFGNKYSDFSDEYDLLLRKSRNWIKNNNIEDIGKYEEIIKKLF